MFLECLNNITYRSVLHLNMFNYFYTRNDTLYMQGIFPPCLQFNLDEACSSLVRSIDHYVSQQNSYIAYQLLITTTILIAIKKESYLTISKTVSHFKHGQNREMKNSNRFLSFEQKLEGFF